MRYSKQNISDLDRNPIYYHVTSSNKDKIINDDLDRTLIYHYIITPNNSEIRINNNLNKNLIDQINKKIKSQKELFSKC